jgi:hypothetical protein
MAASSGGERRWSSARRGDDVVVVVFVADFVAEVFHRAEFAGVGDEAAFFGAMDEVERRAGVVALAGVERAENFIDKKIRGTAEAAREHFDPVELGV